MSKLWKSRWDEELVNEKIKPITQKFYEIQIFVEKKEMKKTKP